MNTHALSRIATVAAAGALMAGCAAPKNPDPRDPWEGFNRGVYKFNDSVDRVVFKPVAQAYTYVTPQPVRSCVHNIFSNVGDLWSGANSMLQGRGHDFVNTLGRFLFNTTMGVGGCFDVASANGARKIPNDFGTTLGVWGIGQGPYLVLPFFGSSTIRDGVGLAGDFYGRKATYTSISAIDNVPLRNSLWGLSVVDARQPAGRDQHDRPRGAGSVQLRARRLPATPRRHGAGPEGGRRVRAAELRRRRGRRQGRRPAMAPVVQPAK